MHWCIASRKRTKGLIFLQAEHFGVDDMAFLAEWGKSCNAGG